MATRYYSKTVSYELSDPVPITRYYSKTVSFDAKNPSRYYSNYDSFDTLVGDGRIYTQEITETTTGFQILEPINIDSESATLRGEYVDPNNDYVGAVVDFIIDGSVVESRTVSTPGEFSFELRGLDGSTEYEYTLQIYRGGELEYVTDVLYFTTLDPANVTEEFVTEIEVVSDTVTTDSILAAIANNSVDQIDTAIIQNDTTTYNIPVEQLNLSKVGNSRLDTEVLIYQSQTDSDTTYTEYILENSSNLVTIPINEAGGKRFTLVVPIVSQ